MLPNLALFALLAGVALEAQPVAAHSAVRHPRAAHQRLAERHAAGNIAKREYQILTRGDGKRCRVRPQGEKPPATGGTGSEQSPKDPQKPPMDEHNANPPATSDPDTPDSPPANSTEAPKTPDTPGAPGNTTTPDGESKPPAASNNGTATDSPDTPANSTETPQTPGNTTPGGGQGSANGGSKNVGSKLGAAWPNGDWTGADQPGWIGNFIGSRTSWYYTWSPNGCKQNDDLGLEFVPMLWGAKQVSEWHAAADSWPSSVKNALFFNEPNQHDQAGIDVDSALGYWINDFLPKTRERGLRIGSAAPTSAPDGVEWVVNFYNRCMEQNGNDNAKCKADFAPVHYYDVDVTNFQNYLQNFHQKVGVNLWVTEYACQNFNGGAQCDEGQTWNFHKTMSEWMDGQDWIERYSPFGMMRNMQGVEQHNALMSPSGDVTALGKWYVESA